MFLGFSFGALNIRALRRPLSSCINSRLGEPNFRRTIMTMLRTNVVQR